MLIEIFVRIPSRRTDMFQIVNKGVIAIGRVDGHAIKRSISNYIINRRLDWRGIWFFGREWGQNTLAGPAICYRQDGVGD
jgi:hypothetical protein